MNQPSPISPAYHARPSALRLAVANLRRRGGRGALVLSMIALAVAFAAAQYARAELAAGLRAQDDARLDALLERAGLLFHDPVAQAQARAELVWIGAISAILCFVGILNTILIGVRERTREIGTLKCLGALDGFVVRLFAMESLLLGLAGSLIGALLGVLLAALQLGWGVGFAPLAAAGLARVLLVALPAFAAAGALLTLAAALYPSWSAARLLPADAMRDET